MSASLIRRLLVNPLTAGSSLDDPATTELHRQIIASKPFLNAIYDEWYRMLAAELPQIAGPVLEFGAGAGHSGRFIPGVITSEVFFSPNVQLIADAGHIPFPDASLRAIIFTDVLHHMPNARQFLAESSRCLRKDGKILMIEPWVTPWSRLVYTKFHHEPFLPDSSDWTFPSTGPLSGANGALPWIIFSRDRQRFESDFPGLAIEIVRPFLPFRYLLSGGVSMRSLMPGFTHGLWAGLERALQPMMSQIAMFAFVTVRRT